MRKIVSLISIIAIMCLTFTGCTSTSNVLEGMFKGDSGEQEQNYVEADKNETDTEIVESEDSMDIGTIEDAPTYKAGGLITEMLNTEISIDTAQEVADKALKYVGEGFDISSETKEKTYRALDYTKEVSEETTEELCIMTSDDYISANYSIIWEDDDVEGTVNKFLDTADSLTGQEISKDAEIVEDIYSVLQSKEKSSTINLDFGDEIDVELRIYKYDEQYYNKHISIDIIVY